MDDFMDAVRDVWQPIILNLPRPIYETGLRLLGHYCYKTLIINLDPAQSPECVKFVISKSLSIGIIAASSIVKIPQLLKLINSQSAEGISFLSYLLETSSYLISLAYNVRQEFPFSTYGETALILVQNVVIAALVLHYTGKSAGAAVWIAGLAAAGYTLFDPSIVDSKTMAILQAGAGVLGVASKAPQIVANYEKGSTGQLSAFAVFNYLLGSLSRIFTTIQEVNDPLVLYGFVSGFFLNCILAFQMVYYWNSPSGKKTVGKKSAGKKSAGKKSAGKKTEKPIAATQTGAPTATSTATSSKGKGPSTRRRG